MNRYRGFSDNINDMINHAVDSMNFGNIGRDINEAFRANVYEDIKLSKDPDAAGGAAQDTSQPGQAGFEGEDAAGFQNTQQNTQTGYSYAQQGQRSLAKVPLDMNPKGASSGLVLVVLGILLAVFFGLGSIGTLFMTGALGAGIFSIFCCGCGVGMIIGGGRMRALVSRFREYSRIIGDDDFIRIRQIAVQCGRKEQAVCADLRQMIAKRMFLEGHLDDDAQYFIGNDAMYRNYEQARQSYDSRQRKKEEEEEARRSETSEERALRKVLEQGMESIAEIHEANDLLPGEHISAQLDTLEQLVGKIFKRVSEKPSLLPEIKKFMDYYLPTTLKLVHVYTDFEKQDLESEQVIRARQDIETTLDTIIEAFQKLLDELYEETVMDVSADISVLKTMFAKDGLSGNDFEMDMSDMSSADKNTQGGTNNG
jgi:5-bromo-4-chloroindolyl phosphate hydrolysis protein